MSQSADSRHRRNGAIARKTPVGTLAMHRGATCIGATKCGRGSLQQMLRAKESRILRNAPVAAGASMLLAEQSPLCVVAEGTAQRSALGTRHKRLTTATRMPGRAPKKLRRPLQQALPGTAGGSSYDAPGERSAPYGRGRRQRRGFVKGMPSPAPSLEEARRKAPQRGCSDESNG
jgi:hypothetical protein